MNGVVTLLAHVPGAPVAGDPQGGFGHGVGLGMDHIGSGADHLLFLLMLLLPAPLVARGGRWTPSGDPWQSLRNTVGVLTAFAVGHSATLVLGATDVIHPPARAVEMVIALSVLVSAVHAIRPLVRGGEAAIALVFGLAHGMAFATLLEELGTTGGSLVAPLLGFNVGIELTQLLAAAAMLPSLYLLSRTAFYDPFRLAFAGLGVVLASSWFLERASLIPSNPLEPAPQALVDHPVAFAAAVALLAAVAHATAPLDASGGGSASRRPV